jgi:hypothetical protein
MAREAMAVINYLALISENPAELTEYYQRFFKTEGIGRLPTNGI